MGSGGTWWSGSWADAVVKVRHPFSLSGQIPAGPRAAAWGGRAGAVRGFGGWSVRPISERRRGALGRRTREGRWRKRRRRVRLWGRIALGPHVCQCWTRRECRIGLRRVGDGVPCAEVVRQTKPHADCHRSVNGDGGCSSSILG
jgi:hypothetical protein